MAVGDVYQLDLKGLLFGVKVANVYHWQIETEIDPAADQGAWIRALFISDVLTGLGGIVGIQSDDLEWTCLNSRKVLPAPPGPIGSTFLSEPGLVASPSLPPACTFKYRFHGISNTRRTRGRKYIPGVAKAYQDRGNVSGATEFANLNSLAAVFDAIQTDGAGNEMELGVYSPTGGTFERSIYTQPSMKIWQLRDRQATRC